MTTTTDMKAERTGNRFAQLLHEYLGPPAWMSMREGNATIHADEGHGKLCDSHAYCDANVFMLQAYEEVHGEEPDIMQPGVIPTMAAAWRHAEKEYICATCAPKADDPILPDSPCCPGSFMKGSDMGIYCRNCKESC